MARVNRLNGRKANRGCTHLACVITQAVLLTGCATTDRPSSEPVRSDEQAGRDLEAATCAILNVGNQRYVEQDYRAAIDAYKVVESIDRYGSGSCTASIYASIATCYSILADRQLAVSASEAAGFYRTASRYNRAFAYAVECQLKDCKNSIDFWKQGY